VLSADRVPEQVQYVLYTVAQLVISLPAVTSPLIWRFLLADREQDRHVRYLRWLI
jgi:hypothetical protein